MAALNFIISILAFTFGTLLMINAKSSIHEANAMLFIVSSAVFFAGGSICYRIACFRDDIANRAARIEQLLIDENKPTDQETQKPDQSAQ